ncbi:sodium/bile acid cotransporter 7 [Pseudoduganella lurida]|uniref:Sodium/bile acid cotransporter 7 n=1 Tax=Pseudoduganella lurida TaxID=1036180 RepID=A0A562RC03_9BURK|nr:bile acid:sodium symporter family protein [Pseudoduganella lurida]TWI66581.1 sodium/bile acid cotransporter 7 [Pseudoduganella lurida]
MRAAALQRFLPETFTLCLLGTVLLASLLPVAGPVADVFGDVTTGAIALLFFLHGARLSRQAVLSGLGHWRLHLLVMLLTFVLFPLLGVLLRPLALQVFAPDLVTGLLFLCLLPSTVQSSIALTALARGNVPAAICSASLSNFLGIFITPVLAGILILHGGPAGGVASSAAGMSLDAVWRIAAQLLLPFLAGQCLRPLVGAWVDRHKSVLKYVDQGSILLVVYGAFSEAVVDGLWSRLSGGTLAGLLLACAVLLAVVLASATFASRRLGFGTEDEIAIVFCGSKKSLASGIPMAKVLFATGPLGMVILPLMLFHQLQLMVCATLAGRYARRGVARAAAVGERP